MIMRKYDMQFYVDNPNKDEIINELKKIITDNGGNVLEVLHNETTDQYYAEFSGNIETAIQVNNYCYYSENIYKHSIHRFE